MSNLLLWSYFLSTGDWVVTSSATPAVSGDPQLLISPARIVNLIDVRL